MPRQKTKPGDVILARPRGRTLFLIVAPLALLSSRASSPASVQDPEAALEAAEVAYRSALDVSRRARADLEAARSERDQARETLRDAETQAFGARTTLRLSQTRGAHATDALTGLAERDWAVRELVRRLEQIPEGEEHAAERREIERRIDAKRASVERLAQRYQDERKAQGDAVERARAELREAEAAVEAAHEALEESESRLTEARARLGAAQGALARARGAFVRAAEEVAPPFLEEIQVEQDGRVVYHARWVEDASPKELLKAQIAELEAEIKELERRLLQLGEERRGYLSQKQSAVRAMNEVQEVLVYNEALSDLSTALSRAGWLLLTTADVLTIYSALVINSATWARHGIHFGAGAATQEALTIAMKESAIVGNALRVVALKRLLQKYGLDKFVLEVLEFEVRELARNSVGWRAAGAAYVGWDFYGELSGLTTTVLEGWDSRLSQKWHGIKPVGSIANLRRAAVAADRAIREFPATLEDLDVRRAARFAIHQQIFPTLIHARADVLREIAKQEDGLFRRWFVITLGPPVPIGPRVKIDLGPSNIRTPESAIAQAKAKVTLVYLDSERSLFDALYKLVTQDEDSVHAEAERRRAALEGLHAAWADATDRRFDILEQAELSLGPDRRASISLRFSGPLGEAPSAVIGDGPIVGGPTDPQGEDEWDLALPGPQHGAVWVELHGSGGSWSGTFETEPLAGAADSEAGFPIRVDGHDPAGKALDANPATAALLSSPAVWENWEEFKHGQGRGRGGPDNWHRLGVQPEGGASYAFVVDASGSMEEGDRIGRVKSSARAFVAQMDKADEVALWAFFDCDKIELVLPFTTDKQALLGALAPIEPSRGTPLAAAIGAGGDHLIAQGRYDRRALVILTDGQETCQGNPQLAAEEFVRRVEVLGYGGRPLAGGADAAGASRAPDAPADAPDDTDSDESRPSAAGAGDPGSGHPGPSASPKPVEVRPADERVWTVSQRGSGRLPTLVVTLKRFQEWGRDGTCQAVITEKRYYAYYGSSGEGTDARRYSGINRTPFSERTLASASCADGAESMETLRRRGRRLSGMSLEEAEQEVERRVAEILDREDG